MRILAATAIALVHAALRASCSADGTEPTPHSETPAEARPDYPTRRTTVVRWENLRREAVTFPVVFGTIASRRVALIVDTGASSHLIFGWFARASGLASAGSPAHVVDSNGTELTTQRLATTAVAIDNWGAVEGPFDSSSASADREFERLGIAGTVAPQRLARHGEAIVLDLAGGRMSLVSATDAARAIPEGSRLLVRETPRICNHGTSGIAPELLVHASIRGHEALLMVDTGADRSLIATDFAASFALEDQSRTTEVDSLSVAGVQRVRVLADVPVRVGDVEVVTSLRTVVGTFDATCPYDGSAGLDVLRSCVLVFGDDRIQGGCGGASRGSAAPGTADVWTIAGGDVAGRDPANAARIWQRACHAGVTVGCNNAAVLYEHGTGVSQNDAMAVDYYRRGCDGGNNGACVGLADHYRRGAGVAVDVAGAARIFDRACTAQEPAACANLGLMYLRGDGVSADAARGIALSQSSCDAGNVIGCTNLASAYWQGQGIPRDLDRAVVGYQRACDLGSMPACAGVAMILDAPGRSVEDYARALSLSQRACDAGAADGCIELGRLVQLGRGTAADPARAAALYERGCAGGMTSNAAVACDALGNLVALGSGVAQDPARAAQWFERGCTGGLAIACRHLADALASGAGVARDEHRAAELYERACTAGDARACEHRAAPTAVLPPPSRVRPRPAH